MKKRSKSNTTSQENSTQEKIIDLKDDLMTVLESYMDELDTDELFHSALQFMTLCLYQCSENHGHALKVLRVSMDDGIKEYMEKRDH